MGSKIDNLYFTMPGFVQGQNEDKVFHGFFGREGGVSTGIYSSLNCGPGSDDNPAHVTANRKVVSDAVGCEPRSLLSLHQIHSDICLTIDEPYEAHDRPQADAFVTDKAGIALGVLTADCTPVLFHGVKGDGSPVVGAAHAGWGGALKGVLAATVTKMVALGAVKDSIVACVGPCISQMSYEVGEDFSVPFLEQDEQNEGFFKAAQKSGHLMFDLAGYNALQLSKAGVKKALIKDLDTYFNEEDFFSYRRATHRKEADYGRQISVVMIKP